MVLTCYQTAWSPICQAHSTALTRRASLFTLRFLSLNYKPKTHVLCLSFLPPSGLFNDPERKFKAGSIWQAGACVGTLLIWLNSLRRMGTGMHTQSVPGNSWHTFAELRSDIYLKVGADRVCESVREAEMQKWHKCNTAPNSVESKKSYATKMSFLL